MKNNIIKLTENDLYKIIKESINNVLKENETENIINILNKACQETDEYNISLYFEDVDTYYITKKFSSRFKYKVFKNENGTVDYVAKYNMDDNKCYLGYIDFGGYSFMFNYLCDLTPEEFYSFFKNFTYIGGAWRRNNSVIY